jgi:hypothetical protein
MDETALSQLTSLYKRESIYSLEFNCPKLTDCLAAARRVKEFKDDNFVQAKSSYVGSEYENRLCACRLLFLSLDPGIAELPHPLQRTPEAVRSQTEGARTGLKAKWVHWYWTHMLALQILKAFNLQLQQVSERLGGCIGVSVMVEQLLQDVTPFFAHANVVKCALGLPRNAQAPAEMYECCRDYLRDELPLLQPDVVITQGKDAADAFVRTVLEPRPFFKYNERLKTVMLGGHEVLWIKTYHPRNGRFFTEGGPCWRDYCQAARDFMDRKRSPGPMDANCSK